MNSDISNKFSGCDELTGLPYYYKDSSGVLRLKKDEIGEVIDFHTHLGMTFLFGSRINLSLETPKVDLFFPYDNPFDLSHYTAEDYTKEAQKKTTNECLRSIYSATGYMSTHTVPNILRDMDRIGVTHAVLHAIDWPRISDNTGNFLRATAGEKRLCVFGSVHPYASDIERQVVRMIELGAVGMKMHPPMQLYTPANKRAYKVYEVCDHYKLPILFHTGASDIAPKWQKNLPAIRHFTDPVKTFPNLIFIFGHSGIHEYDQAYRLAAKHDNIYLETSGQPPQRIKEMINGMGSDRLLFGSDWPWYAIELPLAKVLVGTEGMEEIRRKILSENAKRLMRSIYGEKSPL